MKRYIALIVVVTIAIILFVTVVTPEVVVTVADADSVTSAEGVFWTDDYFTVDYIDGSTIGIGEPRYYQKNLSYLIVGKERALLFDTGAGQEDLSELVGSLTNLPITALPSHLHYDHVGSWRHFGQKALVDLPTTRAQVNKAGQFQPTTLQYLGRFEGQSFAPVIIDQWLPPGSRIDLGERELVVMSIPGHTKEAIALYDETYDYLFVGDHLYPGELFAFLPGADLGEYLRSTRELVKAVTDETLLLPGHGSPDEEEFLKVRQLLQLSDLYDLQRTLEDIAAGTKTTNGLLPVYRVNERITLLTHFSWQQDWETYQPSSLPKP